MLMNFKFYVKRFLLSLFLVLASTMLYAQKKADITGTVYDSDGTTPAVGCAVTIEGTPTGVITDINGKYKIRGGENQTLVFSSLGYKTQKILIGPKTRIDVTLEADSQEIEGDVYKRQVSRCRASRYGIRPCRTVHRRAAGQRPRPP